MISIVFGRRSVCMGDDVQAGNYSAAMPEDAALGDLLNAALHGGNGIDWPIPYTGADSRWVLRSNIGDLAKIYTDAGGEWHIDCIGFDAGTPLRPLGIEWVYGDRE